MQNPLSSATRYMSAFATRFWQQDGTLQTYLDFLMSEIDPMLSHKRNTAEVVRAINETADTKTFVLRPSSRWLGFKAGQYINIEVEVNGVRVRRNYSISSAPKTFIEQQLISITVKKVDGGRASTHLHERLAIGHILTIGNATGEFTLDRLSTTRQVVPPIFIAAGSGITPVMSMLYQLKDEDPKQPCTLIYYSHNAQSLIFEKPLKMLAASMPNFEFIPHFTESEGYITSKQLLLDCPDIAERAIYLCGPSEFMTSVAQYGDCLGVTPERISQESFGLPTSSQHKSDSTGQVSFLKSGKSIKSTGKKTLLELAESAGLNPKYGCRSGICHECKCTKETGEVLNTLTGQLIPNDQTHIQACISVPVGDISIRNL